MEHTLPSRRHKGGEFEFVSPTCCYLHKLIYIFLFAYFIELIISGEKLTPSNKYSIDEVILNDYSLLMNLTIHSLDKQDFGGYICKSANALGKAEGSVRLQGK